MMHDNAETNLFEMLLKKKDDQLNFLLHGMVPNSSCIMNNVSMDNSGEEQGDDKQWMENKGITSPVEEGCTNITGRAVECNSGKKQEDGLDGEEDKDGPDNITGRAVECNSGKKQEDGFDGEEDKDG